MNNIIVRTIKILIRIWVLSYWPRLLACFCLLFFICCWPTLKQGTSILIFGIISLLVFFGWFVESILYLKTRMVHSTDGLNPAIVLGLQIFYGLYYGDFTPLSTYWIYLIGPLIGAVLASLTYNFVIFPYYLRWKKYRRVLHEQINF